MTPQQELTNKRPTDYSKWHRPPTLPDWCYHTDGDWFEQRKCEGDLLSVAYIETIRLRPEFSIESAQRRYELWASKYALMRDIYLRMGIPCFVVRHTPGCVKFSVARFTTDGEKEAVIMNEAAYKDFICQLKPTYPCHNCGATDWWWRQNDGAPRGDWLCGRCHPNPNKEAEMLTDKGHCKHGEFLLREGCPQCIAEMQQPKPKINPYALPSQAYNEYFTPPESGARQPYRLADGTIVPGVTTVLGILDKPGLPYWAWECGRQGLDYREIRDSAGRVGTLAHDLIACHLKGATPVSGEYSPAEVEKAERCYTKYLAWEKANPLTPVMIETPLVSELFKYGGTPDLLAELDGEFALIDFKTGGAVYDSYFAQLAAYRQLLTEQGWPIARARILRISPDDSEYEVAMGLDLDRDFEKFKHCLAIYELQNSGVAR